MTPCSANMSGTYGPIEYSCIPLLPVVYVYGIAVGSGVLALLCCCLSVCTCMVCMRRRKEQWLAQDGTANVEAIQGPGAGGEAGEAGEASTGGVRLNGKI